VIDGCLTEKGFTSLLLLWQTGEALLYYVIPVDIPIVIPVDIPIVIPVNIPVDIPAGRNMSCRSVL
jgi:hypothetical protein